jgi:dTDP-glucose 4,6-dehydratase
VKTVRWYLENQTWVEQIVTGDYVNYYERMYAGR